MNELLKTEKDVWHYLCEKRGEISYMKDQAYDLKNNEGAKVMQIVEDLITSCMKLLKYE